MVTRRQMRAIFSMRLIYNMEATSTRKIDVITRGIGLGAYTPNKEAAAVAWRLVMQARETAVILCRLFSNEHVQSHSPIRTLSF
jgi:hypothetical protein